MVQSLPFVRRCGYAFMVAMGLAVAVTGLRGLTLLQASGVTGAIGTTADLSAHHSVAGNGTVRDGDDGPAERAVVVRQPRKVWSINRFVNDLRRPRPPRHRSERPVSGVDGVQAIVNAAMLKMILMVDVHRPFIVDAIDCRPLSGHYRSLLRPPSALC